MILNQTHVHLTKVDFDLLDAGNVVYHPNYLILCERARNAALSEAGAPFSEMWSQSMALAVLKCTAKYLRALELDQQLAILTQTTEFSGTTIQIQQRITLQSSIDPIISQSGFRPGTIELPAKNLYFVCDFLLGCVKVNPIKGTRLPAQLTSSLNFQGEGTLA